MQSLNSTSKLLYLSIFLTIALILRFLENFLPPLFPIPGAKLGLANMVTILILLNFNFKDSLAFLITRLLLVAFLSTGFFSSAFFISLSGTILSFTFTAFALKKDLFSLPFVGIIGACTHNLGQLLAAMFILNTTALIYYFPILLLLAIPTGLCTGSIAKYLQPKLKNFTNITLISEKDKV